MEEQSYIYFECDANGDIIQETMQIFDKMNDAKQQAETKLKQPTDKVKIYQLKSVIEAEIQLKTKDY